MSKKPPKSRTSFMDVPLRQSVNFPIIKMFDCDYEKMMVEQVSGHSSRTLALKMKEGANETGGIQTILVLLKLAGRSSSFT